ncbi:MarC family protein [Sinirhodobacter huangdaonensis]|uniref:UPF0056 membrane protein n=1 Tax=Paenirhodobacter huangdaonensis TaxID=2501515 RepID=A0A443M011_9RHOB|nr:MarC family protein [Sinirhodobacter huangdaonensis]
MPLDRHDSRKEDALDPLFFIKSLAAFFAIMNPFIALPMFLSLTSDWDAPSRHCAALATIVFSAGMCLVIAVAGLRVLSVFGISIDDFRVAGGIVLATIGLGMLNGKGHSAHSGTPDEQAEQQELDSIAFYPMTFPMIVGPGTIATLVIFTGQVQGLADSVALALAIGCVLLAMLCVLWFSGTITRVTTQTLRVIMTRLMGMILIAIAVDMATTGLKALLPGLG